MKGAHEKPLWLTTVGKRHSAHSPQQECKSVAASAEVSETYSDQLCKMGCGGGWSSQWKK